MAETPSDEGASDRALLPQILKAIRRRRGLRTAEVAARMGMAVRSYERFEAGRGPLNVARIHEFAQATNSDAYAILAALDIRSPAFALRCVDNKLMTLFIIALQEFDAAAQDDIGRLEASFLISGFTQLFDGFTAKAHEIDAFVEQWMSDKALHGPPEADDAGDIEGPDKPEDSKGKGR